MFYLRGAGHWAHAYITGPNDAADTLNLYDVSGLAHFELFGAIANAPDGISAALSDDKWRAVAYATLLTYAGLFAVFLTWRMVSTPGELDRERQRLLDRLTNSLAETRSKLAALQASPPAIDVDMSEIHIQMADSTLAFHASDLPIDCDIFLSVKLTLRETHLIEVVEYELASVLHGNSIRSHYLDDIEHWGLVSEKKPVGIGTTFHYTITKLAKLTHRLERTGVPVDGWLHFHVQGVNKKEIGVTVYRLSVLTPNGAISADTKGEKSLAGIEGSEFQKFPDASCAESSAYY